MTATESTILWLAIWWAVVLIQLPLIRMIASKSTGNMSFDPNGSDLEGYGRRVTRAYGNCVENIPLFMGILIFALVTDNTAITNGTAYWLLFARIAQSVTHMISTSTAMVMVRFTFYLIQVGLIIYWAASMLMA